MKTYRTYSSKETKVLAAVLAEKILEKGPGSAARVICLSGDLGAGKTTFTQGLLKALGARGRVTSPTFVLMKKFRLVARAKKPGQFKRAYHIDAYRFHAPKESGALGLEEIFKDPQAIVFIEWPERLKGLLPKNKTSLRFKHGKTEHERAIIAQ